jgi:hypothetical protein
VCDRRNPRLLATRVYAIVTAEGFEGSYPEESRHLRAAHGPRYRRAERVSVLIETAPGEECQFGWTDCGDFGELFGPGQLCCFGGILCCSRWLLWWFASCPALGHRTFLCRYVVNGRECGLILWAPGWPSTASRLGPNRDYKRLY